METVAGKIDHVMAHGRGRLVGPVMQGGGDVVGKGWIGDVFDDVDFSSGDSRTFARGVEEPEGRPRVEARRKARGHLKVAVLLRETNAFGVDAGQDS